MTKRVFLSVAAVSAVSLFAQPLKTATITVAGYSGSTTLQNFPVLVRVSPERIAGFAYSDCAADGADLSFAFENGTILPHEVDTWNTAGESLVWVGVPSLSSNMSFRIRWQDANPPANAPADVWTAYEGVWHMNAANPVDATGHGHNGVGAGVTATAGRIGGALDCNGTSSSIPCGTYTDTLSAMGLSVSAWCTYEANGSRGLFGIDGVFSFRAEGTSKLCVTTPGKADHSLDAGLAVGNAYFLATTFAPSKEDGCVMYRDGARVASKAASAIANPSAKTMYLANNHWNQRWMGTVDEIRFSKGIRSADWIKAEYDTVADAGFLSYGPAEVLTGDYFLVAATGAQRGVVSPAYGIHTAPVGGQTYTFSCTTAEEMLDTAGKTRAVCTGWKLYAGDGTILRSSADEGESATSFTYEYETGHPVRIVWQWETQYLIGATAEEGGAVSPATQWVADGATASVTAIPDSTHGFYRWTNDVPASVFAKSSTISFPVTGPVSLFATFGNLFFVATNGSDGNDGRTPETAFATIQKALSGAGNGSTVRVLEGEFALTSEILLTNEVTVTGAGMGRTILVRDSNVSSMRIAQINHAGAVLEKVTLKDGLLKSGYAAGAWIRSGTMQDCEVVGCGLAHWSSGWNSGSCVRLDSATARLLRCSLHGNSSSSTWGSGMVLRIDGGGVADSCLIYDNKNTNGSALYTVYVGNGTLRNCTVTENSTPATCAVYLANANSHVYDCIVYNNSGTTATTSNTLGNGFDIKGETAAILGQAGNCYTGNPVFLDPANGDFRIHPASPCADAGQYGASAVSATDAGGTTPRIVGNAIDIGAYETNPGATPYVLLIPSSRSAIVGETLTFSIFSVNAPSPSYTVSFGDGATETTSGASVTHAYSASGTYLPSVALAGAETYTFTDGLVVRPKDLYVAAGSTTGAPPYDTPATAAAYLEDALPYAASGSTIWMADGTYKFKASARISINDGIKIRGISNDPTKVVINPFKASTHRLFRLNHPDAGLYGLTLSGGYNDGGQQAYVGGGVYIDTLGGTVSNCVVRNVPGCRWGDCALAIYMAAGVVTHTVVSNIVGSSSGDDGNHQGVAICMGGGTLANSIVTDVRGGGSSNADKGGAIAVGGSAKVVNCVIAGNRMTGCAGIRFNASTPRIINTIVFGNTSTGTTGDHIGVYNGTGTTYASCFVNCASDVELNETCVQADDLGLADFAAADFHLISSSPCRDKGTTTDIDVPAADLDGNPRVDASGIIDIGAYEVHVSGLSSAISATPPAVKGLIPFAKTFTATVEGGEADSYAWYIDGVLAATTATPTWTKTFDVAGSYVVSLKVAADSSEYDADNTLAVEAYPTTVLVCPGGILEPARQETVVVDGEEVVQTIPAVWHVPVYPYATWETAATNLADAIAISWDGTEIIVSNGTYNLRSAISITDGLTIRGLTGNPEDVVLHAQHPSASNRIGPVVSLNHAAAKLAGLVVQNGTAKQSANGGNIFINTLGGTVSNCIVRNNYPRSAGWGAHGGGILMRGGLVTHCVVSNCIASAYGDNDSYGGGSGVLLFGGVLRDSLITGNSYDGIGDDGKGKFGTVLARGGRVVNCTVVGNEARFCAGIRSEGGTFVNCVSSGNRIAVPGPGTNSLIVTTVPSDVAWYGSGSKFSHCLTDVAIEGGENCQVEDASVTFKDAPAGNYKIRVSSLVRDAGAAEADASAKDLAGNPRLFGKAIDIGCHELQFGAATILLLR